MSNKTGTDVQTLTNNMKEIPTNMRLFSLSLRSLYAEKQVSSATADATAINKIRDDTRSDAIVYVKVLLPLSTHVIRCLEDFFENYEALSLDEWKECLSDIVADVKGYKQCCKEIEGMHEDMIKPLKKRQDEAKIILLELKDLSENLEKKKKEFEENAATNRGWSIGLAFIPGIGTIASGIMGMEADSAMAAAVATGKNIDINHAAVIAISECLIPALSAFVEGLSAVAGFFNVMTQELTRFQDEGEVAIEEAKKLHYIKMKKKAAEMKGDCKEFYAVIPKVRTDLLCIPNKPDDHNYVDKWLIKEQEKIKAKYHGQITGKLSKMIQHFTTDGVKQLLVKEK